MSKIAILSLCFALFLCGEVFSFRNYPQDSTHNVANGDYFVSEKYDGIRAIWDGKSLKTKRGNTIFAPQCFVEKLPPFALDGELWLGYNKFSEIQALVSKADSNCKSWEKVKYMIFDAPDSAENADSTESKTRESADSTESKTRDSTKNRDFKKQDLAKRLEKIDRFIAQNAPQNVIVIKQILLSKDSTNSFDLAINALLDEVVSKGGEGLIIRKKDEIYKQKRSEVSFKLKRQNDAECEVVGYTKGKGKFEGKIGALVCRQEIDIKSDLNAQDWEIFNKICEDFRDSKNAKKFMESKNSTKFIESTESKNSVQFVDFSLSNEVISKNPCKIRVVFKIGSGLNAELRENPPKIGEIITYKYNGFTKNGIPRHSVFLRKFDKY